MSTCLPTSRSGLSWVCRCGHGCKKEFSMATPAQYVPIRVSDRMLMAEAPSVGPVAADERMEVTIRVRPRTALPTLAAAPHLSDQLPQQRRYMSREEYAAAHGANAQDLARVETFARSHGLAV